MATLYRVKMRGKSQLLSGSDIKAIAHLKSISSNDKCVTAPYKWLCLEVNGRGRRVIEAYSAKGALRQLPDKGFNWIAQNYNRALCKLDKLPSKERDSQRGVDCCLDCRLERCIYE